MEFRVLGPIEVAESGHLIEIGPKMHRAILALLLIDANRVVSSDRLVDQLWGDEPPGSATGVLQAYVHNLRRTLEPERAPRAAPKLLVTRAPGYVLHVGPDGVDAASFEALAVEGRTCLHAGRVEEARQALSKGLGLWRGHPYADLAFEPFVQSEATRLLEVQAGASEDLAEAQLRMGDHSIAVADLEGLVASQPLRERRWKLYALALYRSGRQADALRALTKARRTLAEELGIAPHPSLSRLEEDILQHAPSLEWVPPTGTPASSPAPGAPVCFLDVVRSSSETYSVRLDGQRLTIGRASSTSIPLADATVSRLHAVVERYPGGWSLRDLGSANGTWVNGKKLAGERPLRSGDQIMVGDTSLYFRSPAGDAAGATVRPEGH